MKIRVARVLVVLEPDGTIRRQLGSEVVVGGRAERVVMVPPGEPDLAEAVWVPVGEVARAPEEE